MRRTANYGLVACSVLVLTVATVFTGWNQSVAAGLSASVQKVLITNKPLSVKDLPGAPAKPVQFGGKVSPTGSGTDKTATVYTVPAGKRLVIEFVAGTFGAQPTLGLIGISTGSGPTFYLPMGHEPTCVAACHFWSVAQQMRMYANAGEKVIVHSTGTALGGTISFSGYLVNP